MLGEFLLSCNREFSYEDSGFLEAGTPIVTHDTSWGLFYQFAIYISENKIIVQLVNDNGIEIKSFSLAQFSKEGKRELYEYVPWYEYNKDEVVKRALSIPIGTCQNGIFSVCGDDFVCWCITGDPDAELKVYPNILGQHYIENRRKIIKYQHHAIGIEAGLVVHFADNKQGKLDIVVGELNDMSEPRHVIRQNLTIRDRIVARNRALYYACSFLSIDDYNLITNNCEHFVEWCFTGKKKSKQIRNAIGDLAIVALTALTKRPNPLVNKVIKRYLL